MIAKDDEVQSVVEEEIVEIREEEEVEFVDPSLPEPEPDDEPEDEELKGLSKRELAARLKEMSAKGKGPSLEESFSKLAETLRPAPPPESPAPPPPSLKLSVEERKRLKEELYTADDPGELLEGLFLKKMEDYSKDMIGRVSSQFALQEEEILKTSSEEYREFESEIKEIIAELPASQRGSPGVHKWALREAKLRNIDKLIEKGVAKALEGKTSSPSSSGRVVPPRQSSGGVGTGGAPPSKPKVFVDRDVWEREVARATARGIGPGSSMWEATKEALVKKFSKPSRAKVEI